MTHDNEMTNADERPCVALVLGSADGGVGAHVRALVDQLGLLGWDVRVAGPQSTDDLFAFSDAGARFDAVEIRSAAPSPAQFLRARALRRFADGADVVHAHGLRAGAVAVLSRRMPSSSAVGRRPRPPLAVTWHNLVLDPPSADGMAGPRSERVARPPRRIAHELADGAQRISRRARRIARRGAAAVGEQLAARGADVTLGASRDLVAQAQRRGARQARLFEVATPTAMPARSRPQVRAQLGVDADAPLIVTVARLHPQKGLDVLIDASAAWRDTLPGVVVVIAGEGPLREDLQRQIERLDAPVRLLGRRDDVADLLGAADVAVLPSRWEARALAAQEALRVGAPLVATRVGGLPDLVGDAAILIEPDDADALGSAVASLIGDPARRAELSRSAIERSALWPTVADNAAALDALYRRLIAAADGA